MDSVVMLLLGWAVAAIIMALLFLISLRLKEADIVDAGWASCIGVLGVLYAVLTSGDFVRRIVVPLCVLTWSYRLARFLVVHRVMKSGEDGRYVALRQGWGLNAPRNFFLFFQAQAVLAVIFSIPVLICLQNEASWGLASSLGVAVFLVAVIGEGVADRQLQRFKSDSLHHGATCRVGLWRYSRHPNYFFEWLHWWSYPLYGWGSAWWIGTLVGPAFLLYLIYFVTGIPPTEARAVASRGEDYKEYQRTTSAFFPWFPKEER